MAEPMEREARAMPGVHLTEVKLGVVETQVKSKGWRDQATPEDKEATAERVAKVEPGCRRTEEEPEGRKSLTGGTRRPWQRQSDD